jgi:hypothetical protein
MIAQDLEAFHLRSCPVAVQAAKLFLANGSAHYYYSTPMSWSDARAFCLNMGLDLPTIKSAAHNQAIVAALSAGVTGLKASCPSTLGQAIRPRKAGSSGAMARPGPTPTGTLFSHSQMTAGVQKTAPSSTWGPWQMTE